MAALCSAQGAHSRLLSIFPVQSNLFLKWSIRTGSYVCKIAHKMTTIVALTKKQLQFFYIGVRSPPLNSLIFLRIGLNSDT